MRPSQPKAGRESKSGGGGGIRWEGGGRKEATPGVNNFYYPPPLQRRLTTISSSPSCDYATTNGQSHYSLQTLLLDYANKILAITPLTIEGVPAIITHKIHLHNYSN